MRTPHQQINTLSGMSAPTPHPLLRQEPPLQNPFTLSSWPICSVNTGKPQKSTGKETPKSILTTHFPGSRRYNPGPAVKNPCALVEYGESARKIRRGWIFPGRGDITLEGIIWSINPIACVQDYIIILIFSLVIQHPARCGQTCLGEWGIR